MYTARLATIDDAETIARFNQAMAMETEHKALDMATLRVGVRRLFEEPGHGRYLVAESDAGETIASLMITYEWSDWRAGQVWWIQSVYVDPAHRRRGVFKLMYQAVRAMGAESGGVCGYRLYVERDNKRAQHTYEGLGMTQTHYLIYEDLGG